MKRIFTILIIFWNLPHIMGQVEVRITQQTKPSFQIEDFWALEIRNLGGQAIRVFLQGRLLAEDQNLHTEAKSATFLLRPGINRIDQGQLPTLSYTTQNNTPFLAGKYQLCVSVLTEEYAQQLGIGCVFNKYSTPSANADPDNSTKYDFHGNLLIRGQFSNRQGLFQEIPSNYLRVQATPEFSVKGIPLRGQVYLSTEQDGLQYDINSIGLNFRQEDLLQQLRKTATQKLAEQEIWKKKGLPFDQGVLDELDKVRNNAIAELEGQLGSWKQKLQTEGLNQFEELEQLDRIKQILAHPSFNDLQKDWKKLLKEYPLSEHFSQQELKDSICTHIPKDCNSVRQLMSRKEEWDRLQEKYARLKALSKEYEKYRHVADKLRQLEELRKGGYQALLQNPKWLKQLNLMGTYQKWMKAIDQLSIGLAYPNYSNQTLDGIVLKGLDIALQPGNYYVQISAGKLGRTALIPSPSSSGGWLAGGRLGYGKPSKSHLYASFLYTNQLATDSSFGSITLPGINQVMGLEGQIDLLNGHVQLKGESNYSTTQLPPMDSLVLFEEALNPQSSIIRGTAWAVEGNAQVFQGKSRMMGRYAWIAPTYYAAAAPFLMRDRERYELRWEQQLLQNKLSLSAYLRKDSDQLQPYKWTRTTIRSQGVRLAYRPQKGPQLQADYAPFYQTYTATDSTSIQNSLSVLTATIQHSYQLGSIQGTSVATYSLQLNRSMLEGADFSAYLLSINQLLNFSSQVGLTGSFTYMHNDYSSEFSQTTSFDIAANVSSQKLGNYALGIHSLQEAKEAGIMRKGDT